MKITFATGSLSGWDVVSCWVYLGMVETDEPRFGVEGHAPYLVGSFNFFHHVDGFCVSQDLKLW